MFGWFKRLFETRAAPAGILRDPEGWHEFFGDGGRVHAGVSVNSRSVLGHSPLWRGINLLSTSVAKLPLVVYLRNREDREKDVSHPAYPILRRRANAWLRVSAWLRLEMVHAILWGNGYSAIERDAAGRPTALIPLAPWSTWPEWGPDGRLWYLFTDDKGQPRKLRPEDVYHVRGLSSTDGITGQSVIELLAPSIAPGIAATEFASNWFAGGCQLQNVLLIPAHLKGPAREQALKDWGKISEGLGKTGKTGALYDGVDLKTLSTDAEKAQLLQAREFDLIACANVLGVPAHKVGHPARTSYNSLEQENAAFLSESLEPWLTEFEEEANTKLLSLVEQESESHFVEFNRAALLKPDLPTRFTAYATALQNGFMTPNEVRQRENMPRIEGGDDIMRPLNQAPPVTAHSASEGDSRSVPPTEDNPDAEPQDE